MLFFFFKQKTAYEMRISDWSSDVCSSDLIGGSSEQPIIIDAIGCGDPGHGIALPHIILDRRVEKGVGNWAARRYGIEEEVESVSACTKLALDVGLERIVVARLDQRALGKVRDLKRFVAGKNVSRRVALGGRRRQKKTTKIEL